MSTSQLSGVSPGTAKGYEAAVGVLASISTICVALRLLSRVISGPSFWWDDSLIVAATLLVWTSAGAFFWGTITIMGVDLIDLTLDQLTVVGKAGFITGISYAIALSCVKISILIWYRRIFPNQRLRTLIWILTALSAGWGLAFVIADLLGCTPFHSFWNPIPSQHCISGGGKPFVIANAVTNIAIDIPIMALPIPMIWNLQLREGKKWGLRAVFLIGAFVIIASGIRTRYLSISLANVHRLGLWTNIEPNMAIICASLPSLMPLFRRRKARSSKASSGSSELKRYPDPPSKRSWPSARIRPDPDLEATVNDTDDHTGQLLDPRRSSQIEVLSVTGR